MREHRLMPSLSRVAAGAVATLELPIGPTYDRLDFEVSGTGLQEAHIGKIEVRIDGKTVHEYKNLQRLIDLNAYWGRGTDTANAFSIHFYRMEMDGLVFRRMPGLGTADIQTLEVHLHLESDFPVDGTIKAYAKRHESEVLGTFIKVKEFAYASAVAGKVEVDKIPRGPRIVAVHFFKPDISYVEMEADGRKWVDATKSILERDQRAARPLAREPLTETATHVDFCTEGDLTQSMVTASLQDLRFKLTLDTAGAVDIVVEYLDLLEGQGAV